MVRDMDEIRMQALKIVDAIIANMEKAIVGKRRSIELVVLSLLGRGHVLLEDVPGVGKTSLVSALARSVDCSFNRIQFTPDIMPSDITGFSMFNRKTGEFEYRPGAVMCHFLLADEINRTSAKTQASLLEVMQENQVTVDGQTYAVPRPFMVIATQNPIEYLGTYPLPEAQMDRFFMRISLGYPTKAQEQKMLAMHAAGTPIETLSPVANGRQLIELQKLVTQVHTDPAIFAYIVDLAEATRQHPQIDLGLSPRGSIALHRASQALAFCKGRDYILPDDVQTVLEPVVAHRLVLKREAKIKGAAAESLLREIVNSLPVPGMGQRPARPENGGAGEGMRP